MRAAILYGKELLQVEDVEVPEIGPGELLVRVRTALTCGTDLKVFQRGYHAKMIRPPCVFGHEFAGDVVAVGTEVQRFWPNQRVVAGNSAPCGLCYICRRGCANVCEDLLFNNGAYAEYIRIPARIVESNTYTIDDGVDYCDAALSEPIACVLRGLEATPVQTGDTLAVIGLGPIGLMFVQLAKLRGARIIAVGKHADQLERAEHMGADEIVSLEEQPDAVAAVRRITGGHGVDVSIEAVGRPETWVWAMNMVRRGGAVNFFGGCAQGTLVALDTGTLHYSDITCKASFHHTPRHIRAALALISSGRVRAADFVKEHVGLGELPGLMRELAGGHSRQKTAIVP